MVLDAERMVRDGNGYVRVVEHVVVVPCTHTVERTAHSSERSTHGSERGNIRSGRGNRSGGHSGNLLTKINLIIKKAGKI